jgi:sulfopyruvate decarboxylase alpha subunit
VLTDSGRWLAGRYHGVAVPDWTTALLDAMRGAGIRNLSYVADSMLGGVIAAAEAAGDVRLIPVHREGEAVGVVCGLYVGGERGAVLLQSSGVGNCLNALGALAIASRIPVPLFIGMRGELDEWNPAQLPMGRAVPGCLDALHVPSVSLMEPHLVGPIVASALKSCFASGQPFGILLSALLTRTVERRK